MKSSTTNAVEQLPFHASHSLSGAPERIEEPTNSNSGFDFFSFPNSNPFMSPSDTGVSNPFLSSSSGVMQSGSSGGGGAGGQLSNPFGLSSPNFTRERRLSSIFDLENSRDSDMMLDRNKSLSAFSFGGAGNLATGENSNQSLMGTSKVSKSQLLTQQQQITSFDQAIPLLNTSKSGTGMNNSTSYVDPFPSEHSLFSSCSFSMNASKGGLLSSPTPAGEQTTANSTGMTSFVQAAVDKRQQQGVVLSSGGIGTSLLEEAEFSKSSSSFPSPPQFGTSTRKGTSSVPPPPNMMPLSMTSSTQPSATGSKQTQQQQQQYTLLQEGQSFSPLPPGSTSNAQQQQQNMQNLFFQYMSNQSAAAAATQQASGVPQGAAGNIAGGSTTGAPSGGITHQPFIWTSALYPQSATGGDANQQQMGPSSQPPGAFTFQDQVQMMNQQMLQQANASGGNSTTDFLNHPSTAGAFIQNYQLLNPSAVSYRQHAQTYSSGSSTTGFMDAATLLSQQHQQGGIYKGTSTPLQINTTPSALSQTQRSILGSSSLPGISIGTPSTPSPQLAQSSSPQDQSASSSGRKRKKQQGTTTTTTPQQKSTSRSSKNKTNESVSSQNVVATTSGGAPREAKKRRKNVVGHSTESELSNHGILSSGVGEENSRELIYSKEMQGSSLNPSSLESGGMDSQHAFDHSQQGLMEEDDSNDANGQKKFCFRNLIVEKSSQKMKFVNSDIKEEGTNQGAWSEREHQAFLKGLQELGYGKWREIADRYVKTRTRIQVASHSQKYHQRLERQARKKKKQQQAKSGKKNGDGVDEEGASSSTHLNQ